MKKNIYLFLPLIAYTCFTLFACNQNTANKGKQEGDLLTMIQIEEGKWVITNSQKTPLYDVFFYDNGPDYPAEGLIRIVKNGKIGYADANTYRIVIEAQFDCAYPFENGKAKVSKHCTTVKDDPEYSRWESDKWQYIDKKGIFSE
jgi:hypothetical protein